MKNIVIVGGSRGIGRALALKLSESHQVLVLSRNIEALRELQEIERPNPIRIESLNLTAPHIRDYLNSVIQVHFNKVDLLINNAGYLVNKPFLELSEEDIQTTLNTNVAGMVLTCQALVPFMEGHQSHIVNIGSMGGFQGSVKFPGLSIYSASKSAVAGFTECLAEELKDKVISVNCLALGAAQTEMLEEAFPGYEAPVSAEKMAEFIAEFGLSGHQWVNGKVIPVSLSTP